MRFSDVFRYNINSESYGAVRFCDKSSYGAVPCGFRNSKISRCGSDIFQILWCGSVQFSYYFVNATVRCGAVFQEAESYGAVR